MEDKVVIEVIATAEGITLNTPVGSVATVHLLGEAITAVTSKLIEDNREVMEGNQPHTKE